MAQYNSQSNGTSGTTKATEKHALQTAPPSKHIERMQRAKQEKGELGIAVSELWVGVAAEKKEDGSVDIGFACHDGTYNIDFAVHTLGGNSDQAAGGSEDGSCPTNLPSDKDGQEAAISEYLICAIRTHEQSNHYKFLGAGLSQEVVELSPQTPARLWSELDIVPVVIPERDGGSLRSSKTVDDVLGVDELADSMSRKCLAYVASSSHLLATLLTS